MRDISPARCAVLAALTLKLADTGVVGLDLRVTGWVRLYSALPVPLAAVRPGGYKIGQTCGHVRREHDSIMAILHDYTKSLSLIGLASAFAVSLARRCFQGLGPQELAARLVATARRALWRWAARGRDGFTSRAMLKTLV